MNMDKTIDSLAKLSSQKAQPDDYMQDGLLYCGKCHTPKQCRVTVCGHSKVVGCLCSCQSDAYNEQIRKEQEEKKRIYIDGLRAQGIQEKALRKISFADAEQSIQPDNIARCKAYAERFPEMLENNNGLIFWGNFGTGKTFAASCIANALIEKGIPVMVTSFPKILNAGFDERADIIRQMKEFDLLVIDDLGAERQNQFSMETVYMIVDERYKTQKPMIVTTNLKMEELRNPANMDYGRIYSRILEMCVPMLFDGPSLRKKKGDEKLQFAKKILGGKT